ncbi:MAG: hypothetical protein LBU69_05180 [Deltaproteobacteria bacterium]|nr:hypothetical protein [Deltaproteobacteria bacterium]
MKEVEKNTARLETGLEAAKRFYGEEKGKRDLALEELEAEKVMVKKLREENEKLWKGNERLKRDIIRRETVEAVREEILATLEKYCDKIATETQKGAAKPAPKVAGPSKKTPVRKAPGKTDSGG